MHEHKLRVELRVFVEIIRAIDFDPMGKLHRSRRQQIFRTHPKQHRCCSPQNADRIPRKQPQRGRQHPDSGSTQTLYGRSGNYSSEISNKGICTEKCRCLCYEMFHMKHQSTITAVPVRMVSRLPSVCSTINPASSAKPTANAVHSPCSALTRT